MSAMIRATGIRTGRLRQCASVLLLLGFFLSSSFAAQNTREVNMFPNCANRVTDPESNLAGRLTVLRGGDGGSSKVVVELRNPSDDYDVVLKINTEMSTFIMLTVTDEQGNVLSKPARKFNSSEVQQFVTVLIGRASSHEWRVPIAAQLDANAIPKQGLKGRLVVNVALLYSKVSGEERPADADFKSSLLTLYDMDVLFTQAALSEGAKPAAAAR
jgi:hypothetical protein